MKNITPVSTFTAPVTVVEDGDSVNGANSEVTAQALTNRTQELSDRVGTRDAASGFVGLDANKNVSVTATTGSAISGTAGTNPSDCGIVGTADGSGLPTSAAGVKGVGAGAVGGIIGIGGPSGGFGVDGYGGGASATGVIGRGASPSGHGTQGVGVGSGNGVRGNGGNTSGTGVVGTGGTNGVGVAGIGNGSGAGLVGTPGGTAPGLQLVDSGSTIALLRIPGQATPTGAHQVGDMYVTTAGVLKICTVAGTPGTFVSVGTQT